MGIDEPQPTTAVGAHGAAAVAVGPPFGGHPFERPAITDELLLQSRVFERGGGVITVVLVAEEFARAVHRQGPTIHHDTY
jgi:hypothetical protein